MNSILIEQIRDALGVDGFWQPYLDEFVVKQPASVAVHLGVFTEPFLQYVIEGQKTIESRFSVTPCPPYRRVKDGDVLLLKQVGGPVVGICQVGRAWFYRIDPDSLAELRSQFATALCAPEPEFWNERASAGFATLMSLRQVRKIRPVRVEKRDRRGWVIVRKRSKQLLLWNH